MYCCTHRAVLENIGSSAVIWIHRIILRSSQISIVHLFLEFDSLPPVWQLSSLLNSSPQLCLSQRCDNEEDSKALESGPYRKERDLRESFVTFVRDFLHLFQSKWREHLSAGLLGASNSISAVSRCLYSISAVSRYLSKVAHFSPQMSRCAWTVLNHHIARGQITMYEAVPESKEVTLTELEQAVTDNRMLALATSGYIILK